jgi:hypothetical protein
MSKGSDVPFAAPRENEGAHRVFRLTVRKSLE